MGNRQGFALVAAMMILALLSILGVAAIQSATLETQISARDRDARLALYLAQSALEEARYYAARGWGKLEAYGTLQVRVATPPLPGLDWSDNRYQGLTLVDSRGDYYPVSNYTSGANPVITVTGGTTPAVGRFLLFRDSFTGAWSGNRLNVPDAAWAAVSGVDTWRGWLLWDMGATPPKQHNVTNSDTDITTTPATVLLTVTPAPSSPVGPYLLSVNPWVSAMAAGSPLPGDADAATPSAWDRVFFADTGAELGRGSVTARLISSGAYSGAYELESVGRVDPSQREATLHVYYAGLPDQRIRDWEVR
jgi:type II secretory pathway pseudopilin PulG